ncbi:MAG: hypothetical protein ACJ8AB_00960 [Gemmatimonadaceae bacterium]
MHCLRACGCAHRARTHFRSAEARRAKLAIPAKKGWEANTFEARALTELQGGEGVFYESGRSQRRCKAARYREPEAKR